MVEDAEFSKTSFNSQSADVKSTKWSAIESWGGGGLIKICRDRLFISNMDARTFPVFLHEKHRVALLTPGQKIADSIPGRPPSGKPCVNAGYTRHAKHP